MKKPKPEELYNDLLPECRNAYSELHEKLDRDEKYYELLFKDDLNIPTEFADEAIVLPTGRDVVDTFVDHMDVSNARVYVNKKGTSTKSVEEDNMMRKLGLGLLHRTNVEADISPWRVAAKHFALHGLAVIKDVYSADLWPDKPVRKKGESEESYAEKMGEWMEETGINIPIIIQAIHPKVVLGDPSFSPVRSFVFEDHKRIRKYLDDKEKFKKWTNPLNKRIDEEIEYIIYSDATWRCEWADGEKVFPGDGMVDHKYGFLPYVFIESGLGNLDSQNRPHMRYVGIIRYIFDLLMAESRDFSISDTVLARNAWPGGFLTGVNAASVKRLKLGYGTWEALPEGVIPVPVEAQIPPDALNALLYRTADYIAAHAAPRSVRGLSESGVRSGTDRAKVIAEASAKYTYSKEAFRNGAAKVLSNCARLVKDVIPGDVRVWARTPSATFDIPIKKDLLKPPFVYYVDFAPISEEDEYRRHDDLERQVREGIITPSMARRKLSDIDPEEAEIEVEMEKLNNSPFIQQIKDTYAAGKLAQAIAKRTAAEVAKGGTPPPQPTIGGGGQGGAPGAPSGAPVGNMVPGTPNIAGKGSPQDLQIQLSKNRSPRTMRPGQGRGGGART